jgi:hypothetical protein
MTKKEGYGEELLCFVSLTFLKQQVMIDYVSHTFGSTSVGVETPAIPLVFLNCFADILVVLDFHAFIFFQLNITIVL